MRTHFFLVRCSIVAVATIMLCGAVRSQNFSACCSAPAAELGMYSDPAFLAAHAAPEPFTFSSQRGMEITFHTSGADGHGYLVRAAHPTAKVVLMFHEWWGLNDFIKQEAVRLCDSLGDANVFAIDLFDGVVATTPEAASKQMSAAKPERLTAIIEGAIKEAKNKIVTNGEARIGTIGWCFGGGWSLQAAFLAGKNCTACVIYYGMPDTSAAKIKSLSAPVLGIFAGRDKWITPEVVKEFSSVMKAAGKHLTAKSYDADHAFANPSNPIFNKEAKESAEKVTLKFFRVNL